MFAKKEPGKPGPILTPMSRALGPFASCSSAELVILPFAWQRYIHFFNLASFWAKKYIQSSQTACISVVAYECIPSLWLFLYIPYIYVFIFFFRTIARACLRSVVVMVPVCSAVIQAG